MRENSAEDLCKVKPTEEMGLPDPKLMFQSGAYEPTGLKMEFQMKNVVPRVGDVFIYFGKWVCCVEMVGGNFSVTYDLDQNSFGVAAFTGVDTRCVGSPRIIEKIDVDSLRKRYQESQRVLTINEAPAFSDGIRYTLKDSGLAGLSLKLIVTDGFLDGKKMPMESRTIKLGTYDDIKVDNKGNVIEHIIVPKVGDRPTIVVGDWHQSIIPELPIIRGLGLLPKRLPPQIDWLDQHTDEYAIDFHPFGGGGIKLTPTEQAERDKLLTYPETIREAIRITKKIHCGRAALALSGEVTHITHPAIFQDLPPARWIDIFSTANPFARKSNQPHVLSLDCDFFDLLCRNSQDPLLLNRSFAELTRYLIEEKGLDFRQYDAVMIYTSPKYCSPEVARKVIEFVRKNT